MSNHFPGKLGKVLKKAKGNWDSSGAKKKKNEDTKCSRDEYESIIVSYNMLT